MNYQKYAVIIWLSIVSMLHGCAAYSITTIPIEEVPELKIGSPLAGIRSLTFLVNEFEDARPFKGSVILASERGRIELNQKVSELVTQSIANELKRNGHKVLRSNESDNADVIIKGVVRRYWIESKPVSLFSLRLSGTVEAEISVNGQGTEKVIPKIYRGDYYIDGNSIGPLIWRDILNQALTEMIKEFTTDEEFLGRIKQVRRKSS